MRSIFPRYREVKVFNSEKHHLQGADVSIARTTIYDWLQRYTEGGYGVLTSGTRADRGKRRVLISRNWDCNIDLDDDTKERVSETMENYAKRFIRNDGSLSPLYRMLRTAPMPTLRNS